MASTNLFFLLDLSGSMTLNGRLNQINNAMPDVLAAVSKELLSRELEVEASVRVIGFNSSADYLIGSVERGVSLADAISQWDELKAGGTTRTGLAFEKASEAMHTRYLTVDGNTDNQINAPVVILFTDGYCSENYKSEFDEKLKELRSKRISKSGRETILRIAIGVNDAKESELEEFASVWPTVVGKDEKGLDIVEDRKQVYMVDDAEDIKNMLQTLAVSSVKSSSLSGEENEVVPINPKGNETDEGGFSTDFSDFK